MDLDVSIMRFHDLLARKLKPGQWGNSQPRDSTFLMPMSERLVYRYIVIDADI